MSDISNIFLFNQFSFYISSPIIPLFLFLIDAVGN